MPLDRKFIFLLLVLCVLPSLMFVGMKLSALTLGLAVAALICCFVNFGEVVHLKGNYRNWFASLIFLISLLISSFFSLLRSFDFKPLFSVILFSFIIFSALLFSQYVRRIPYEVRVRSIAFFLFFLVFLGVLKLVYVPDFLNYQFYKKAVFPFSEESHFGLFFGFLSVYYVFFSQGGRFSIFFIFSMIAFSLLYPSLLMALYAVIASICYVLVKRAKILMVLILSLLALLFFAVLNFPEVSFFQYFVDRLDFSESSNLTALVFLQGWELSYLNFTKNGFWGLGFQNLGGATTAVGDFTLAIAAIAANGVQYNINDGGFLAAKIMAEFGILGVLFCFLYAFSVIKYFIIYFIRDGQARVNGFPLLIAFLPEFFFRGVGYFSPTLFLFFVFFFLNEPSNEKNSSIWC